LIETGSPPDRISCSRSPARSAAEMVHRVGLTTDPAPRRRSGAARFHATRQPIAASVRWRARIAARLHRARPRRQHRSHGLGPRRAGPRRARLALSSQRERSPRSTAARSTANRNWARCSTGGFRGAATMATPCAGLFSAYTQRKRRHHVLDYDDLLLYWRALAGVERDRQCRSQLVRSRARRRIPGHQRDPGRHLALVVPAGFDHRGRRRCSRAI
jgi:superfamily I DNA/RNA helicase